MDNFAHRITRLPITYDQTTGQRVVQLYQSSLLTDKARDLIIGTAGCSPYLADLLEHSTDFVTQAITQPPEQTFNHLMQQTDALPLDIKVLHTQLRHIKKQVALLVALADLAGVWSLHNVTHALTQFADKSVQRVLCALWHREYTDCVNKSHFDNTKTSQCPIAILAMGKMGAHELNYSSDIDLICLFDHTFFHSVEQGSALTTKIIRHLMSALSDIDKNGYVFRTDLRLRPDPTITPVCIPFDSAEKYYEGFGRTWERAAYIKARPIAGNISAGEAFLERLHPFIWRRYLDYASIEDIRNIRQRIKQSIHTLSLTNLHGYDLKRGKGGIRDIELFVQTWQLIAGGRNPSLRVKSTKDALTALAKANWFSVKTANTLIEDYENHRTIEHCLQMILDRQTHSLPTKQNGFTRLAHLTGTNNTSQFQQCILERLDRVAHLTQTFLAPALPPPDPLTTSHSVSHSVSRQQNKPTSLHIQDTGTTKTITSAWPLYPALRSERALRTFERLRPQIFYELNQAHNPNQVLLQFDAFLRNLPHSAQVFALLEATPALVKLIIDICATAPSLADHLAKNTNVFDSFIDGDFFVPIPQEHNVLKQELETFLTKNNRENSYESFLRSMRQWKQEHHFRIGVHHLHALDSAERIACHYSNLAHVLMQRLWQEVNHHFVQKHGKAQTHGSAVIAFGSFGRGAMTNRSDLDLMIVYDTIETNGHSTENNPSALAPQTYYNRLTRALIAALSAPMAEGKLYNVDMRLRPSGKQGPVATDWNAFKEHQTYYAETWEHMALTQARAVAGTPSLCQKFEDLRFTILNQKRKKAKTIEHSAALREHTLNAKSKESNLWNAKLGHGRLLDMNIMINTIKLLNQDTNRNPLKTIESAGLTKKETKTFIDTYRLLWHLHMAQCLLSHNAQNPNNIGSGACQIILRETKMDSLQALENHLLSATQYTGDLIKRFFAQ